MRDARGFDIFCQGIIGHLPLQGRKDNSLHRRYEMLILIRSMGVHRIPKGLWFNGTVIDV
jgi:hypothetical protein